MTNKNDYTAHRWIPPGSTKVAARASTAVAYLFENSRGKPAAVGYVGKAGKKTFHFHFKDDAQRTEFLERFFAGQATRADTIKVRREARKVDHAVKVGTVYYTSWGYDQTNVEYFEVVKVTPRTVVVREIGKAVEETGFMSGTSKPAPGKFLDDSPEIRCLVGSYKNAIKIDDVRSGWVHEDGQVHNWSSYA